MAGGRKNLTRQDVLLDLKPAKGCLALYSRLDRTFILFALCAASGTIALVSLSFSFPSFFQF